MQSYADVCLLAVGIAEETFKCSLRRLLLMTMPASVRRHWDRKDAKMQRCKDA